MTLRTYRRYALPIASVFATLAVMSASATTVVGSPADGCTQVGGSAETRYATASGTSTITPGFPPPQLQVRTPYAPTYFPSGGRFYLIYELHLQNFSNTAMDIQELDVTDPASLSGASLVTFSGSQLRTMLQPVGAVTTPKGTVEAFRLGEGRTAVAFLCLAFDSDAVRPSTISHRILLPGASVSGPGIHVSSDPLRTLASPVTGSDWIAADGPSNESHHRLGLFVAGGTAQISRRYAIDWKQIEDGKSFSGDALDVHSYHAYGHDVHAVADAKVVSIKDGLPDNIPRTPAGFKTAVAISTETVAGNFIVLDLGGGQFASYAHLKAGSLRVRAGDQVKRGQVLANIGNSGDAREPHLHFQLTDSPDILASEGIPYVIDHYAVRTGDGWNPRSEELPISGMMIDFDPLTPK